jgi:hypothetical protein
VGWLKMQSAIPISIPDNTKSKIGTEEKNNRRKKENRS